MRLTLRSRVETPNAPPASGCASPLRRAFEFAVFVVCCLVAAPSVHAQQAIHGDGVDPTSATPVQVEQAQSRFLKGKELFVAGDYQGAHDEFEASRGIVASPNTRLYQARCLRHLDDKVTAYAVYGLTMIEALELAKLEARYARTAEAARVERSELEAELAFIKLTIHNPHPETRLTVNDETIRRTAWGEPVVILPGETAVVLTTPGRPEQKRALSVAPGATEEVTLSVEAPAAAAQQTAQPRRLQPLTPAEPRAHDSGLSPYTYGAAALGAVGFGSFGVFGVMSRDSYEDLSTQCNDGSCPSTARDTIDAGKRQQLLANIGLAVGVVATSAAITLWALDDDDTAVEVGLTPSGIRVKGRL